MTTNAATWLGQLTRAARRRSVAALANGAGYLFWCSPYCPRVFDSPASRSRHRVECEAFARFSAESLSRGLLRDA